MTSFPVSALLWFVAIVALIPLALWLLKRTPMGAGAQAGLMRSVAMLPVSHSQRILTIEVGHGDERRWLVLGVTPGSITTLHTMLPSGDAPPSSAPAAVPPPFAAMLARLGGARRDGKDADAR